MPIVKDPEAKRLLEEMERDTKWYLKNREQIVQAYNDEFVAILDQRVVAHNPDMENLLRELPEEIRERQPSIEFISEEGIELVL